MERRQHGPSAPPRLRLPDRAYLQGNGWSAALRVVFRNRRTAPISVTADVELQGNGHRKSRPHGPFTIAAGSAAGRQVMAPFGGSLAGSIRRVTIAGCTPSASCGSAGLDAMRGQGQFPS